MANVGSDFGIFVHKKMKRRFRVQVVDHTFHIQSLDMTPQITVALNGDVFRRLYVEESEWQKRMKRKEQQARRRAEGKEARGNSTYGRGDDCYCEYVCKMMDNVFEHGCYEPARRRIDEFQRDPGLR